jgi:hypothetical protein
VVAARRERAARSALGLDKIERQIRRDERVLQAMRLTVVPEDAPDEAPEPVVVPFNLRATS